MPLSSQARRLLVRFADVGVKQFHELGVIESRSMVEASISLQEIPAAQIAVDDVLVPASGRELAVRLYRGAPDGAQRPLLVYVHGGGWVTGSVAVADRPCRALAAEAAIDVASVEYRRSPETKFPGAVEDCYAAISWLAEQRGALGLHSSGVAVCGDSAGGNLAAATALMARDRGVPEIAFQILIYPSLVQPGRAVLRSHTVNGEGYGLTLAEVRWFWERYLAEADDALHRYASPLLERDLSRLPPALIVAAEFDVLRDEAIAYADRLRAAGVVVDLIEYPGTIHGFFWMDRVLDEGKRLRRDLAAWISARPDLNR